MVRASDLQSEDPGFYPLAGQGEGQFFLSLRVNSHAELFVPDPPLCVQHAPKFDHQRSHIDLSSGFIQDFKHKIP